MITSIQIRGYRGFEDFEMSGLERVNLLVGTNNSGKTSVLEALYLLTSRGAPLALWQVLWRRGERLPERSPNSPEMDVCHLFTGHDLHIGSKFTLTAKNESPEKNVTFTIGEISDEHSPKPSVSEGVPVPSRLGLHIKGIPTPPATVIPLTRSGGVSSESLESPRRVRGRFPGDEVPAQFITTESLSGGELVALWDKVALTSNEERVLLALQFLEPGIERIAAQAAAQSFYGGQRGGFIIRLKGHERPVPIGSMGDGMWRMMAMAIAIAQCKGGVLLIDEIDTGLHYTVMEKMWRLIFGAAKELDVQVFASTHSYDCIKSLADLCYSETDASENVTLQRIEVGNPKAVPYTDNEIEIAAEKNIEVR
jgi:AAA domain, putative AbiEii toxin, Type IV TA system/AAA ATPase domain